jgi:hypothetical protein
MLAVWTPGRRLPAIFGERFALFNSGKNGKAFPFIGTFISSLGASSPSARS